MKTFPNPPTEREYTHANCGNKTMAAGESLRDLCDPRYAVHETFCAGCQQSDTLDAFCWSDTRETLADYRHRLNGLVSPLVRIVASPWLFAVWIALAALVGYGLSQFVSDYRIAYGVPAVIFFLIGFGCDAVGKLATNQVPYHQFQ